MHEARPTQVIPPTQLNPVTQMTFLGQKFPLAQKIPLAQTDPVALRRLKWRARRGLLENDILIARFLGQRADGLTQEDVLAFEALLDLPDNDLLDLLLRRTELPTALDEPAMRQLLSDLRTQ